MELEFIDTIPIIRPGNIVEPWLIAFTAIATAAIATKNDVMSNVDKVSGLEAERTSFDYLSSMPDPNSFSSEPDRQLLGKAIAPLKLTWLALEHGNRVVIIPDKLATLPEKQSSQPPIPTGDTSTSAASRPRADAAIVATSGFAVALTTADCLPIIFACPRHRCAAVVHAGWRGLAQGIIENTLNSLRELLGDLPADTLAWIGPSIHQADYEIGAEVRRELLTNNLIRDSRFCISSPGRFFVDLQGIASDILFDCGLDRHNISVFPVSTKADFRLHSARRDGSNSGRMATVVGISE